MIARDTGPASSSDEAAPRNVEGQVELLEIPGTGGIACSENGELCLDARPLGAGSIDLRFIVEGETLERRTWTQCGDWSGLSVYQEQRGDTLVSVGNLPADAPAIHPVDTRIVQVQAQMGEQRIGAFVAVTSGDPGAAYGRLKEVALPLYPTSPAEAPPACEAEWSERSRLGMADQTEGAQQ